MRDVTSRSTFPVFQGTSGLAYDKVTLSTPLQPPCPTGRYSFDCTQRLREVREGVLPGWASHGHRSCSRP